MKKIIPRTITRGDTVKRHPVVISLEYSISIYILDELDDYLTEDDYFKDDYIDTVKRHPVPIFINIYFYLYWTNWTII